MLLLGLPSILQGLAGRGLGLLITQPGLSKDLGVFLQRKAFQSPAMLPIYGSSELTEKISRRPDMAFRDAPSGFQVCPVGQPGNTSLMMAEKLAALGPALEDRKLVIMLSFSWFHSSQVRPEHYAGNFSFLQALKVANNSRLGDDLTRRFASRMLDYPDTLTEHPELAMTLERIKMGRKPGWRSHWLRGTLALKNWELSLSDYVNTIASLVAEISGSQPVPAPGQGRPPATTPGPAIASLSSEPVAATASHGKTKAGHRDDSVIEATAGSLEWTDFELLLDTLARFKARPLIIAIPMDGLYDEMLGTSQATRMACYYDHMAALCAKRGFAFEHFPEHDHDPDFLVNHWSHPSAQGWQHINAVLEAFYHDRPYRSKPQAPALATSPPPIPETKPSTTAAPAPPANDPLAQARPGQTRTYALPGGVEMTFCYCPPGTFTMGSPASEAGRDEDENAVPVKLTQGFWLGRTECSQAQWSAFLPLPKLHGTGAGLPVDTVTWTEVQTYLHKLQSALPLPPGWTVTLPTEAQWEHACRAGTTSAFSFGNVLDGSQANCYGHVPYGTATGGPSLQSPSRTGSYPANPWGLCDMHGNVWEFCADWYAPALTGGIDPRGPAAGTERVLRGGSWSNYPVHCRSAYRSFGAPDAASPAVGFRPALVFAGEKDPGAMR